MLGWDPGMRQRRARVGPRNVAHSKTAVVAFMSLHELGINVGFEIREKETPPNICLNLI